MELPPEDSLRLNVLLANDPQAIRINESNMTVTALTSDGESTLQLNPTVRDDRYIKYVKELLSGHVLGSPGGYPVYLQRWTRMGQMRDESLEELLKLGEPEAVVAAVCAPGLSDELARRAWWAMEDPENARQMLMREAVVKGQMGPVLAQYLVEHLPFEVEPEKMMETVRLVLQAGLIDEETRVDLWQKAQRKNAYYVGFLAARPDDLPDTADPHSLLTEQGEGLKTLVEQRGNNLANLLLRVLGAQGQVYLNTIVKVLKKPVNQDVVVALLDVLANGFRICRGAEKVDLALEELIDEADQWVKSGRDEIVALRALSERFLPMLRAGRVLSGMGYGVVRPALKGTDAMGSLMRRKLEPIVRPLRAEIDVFRN